MLISEEVEIELNNQNTNYYECLGYTIPRWKDKKGRIIVKRGTKIIVQTQDLPKGSHTKVEVKCDCECCKNPYLKPMKYQDYIKCVKEDGKYYCQYCAKILYGGENIRKSRLQNSRSFEQWCLDNNRQDILDRWDYELNKCKPSEISYSSEGFYKKGYYFKCPKGLHESELKNISSIVSGIVKYMDCNKCNSFAQYIIDTYGEDELDIYWNWELNNKLKINPWKVSKSKHLEVWINCRENSEHGNYLISLNKFTSAGNRCPKCNISKGERIIKEYLEFNNINFVHQKKYENLKGIGNRCLSYDFYLSDYDLLIEYQGQYHDGTSDNNKEENFIIQQEHDKRKREYAKDHTIKLLEIWYYDYSNIQTILQKELNIKNYNR